MENSGLCVALALAHLDPLAALPAAVMTVWEYISASLLAGYWGARADGDDAAPEIAEASPAK